MRYSRKEKPEVPKCQMLAANILKSIHYKIVQGDSYNDVSFILILNKAVTVIHMYQLSRIMRKPINLHMRKQRRRSASR